jgi:glycosyltransferase involved in cell wall biosynthesis
MIRVLHLVPTGHVGGVETFVYDLARHLDPDRVRVGVCSLAGEGPMLDRIRDTGAECFSIDVRRGIAPRAAWTYLTRLRRGRFDIVHANAGGRKLKRLARWSGCRVVSHCHGYPFDRPTNAATARELQRTYRAASDWLVFSCAWLRDRFEEHGPAWADRSSVIHCGVDASRFCDVPEEARRALRAGLGVPSDRPVVGFVGRFTDQKGLPWLFAAAKSLLAADPKTHFLLVGDGPLRAYVDAQIAALGRENFTVAGPRPEVECCLPVMDVVVLPSNWEATPIVLLEAMAAERPVVAYDVGGVGEAMLTGETGILVRHGELAGLGSSLSALLRNPARRRQMGAAARRHVQRNFTLDATTARIARLYQGLVDEGRRSRNTLSCSARPGAVDD